jgi:hypothetical protein
MRLERKGQLSLEVLVEVATYSRKGFSKNLKFTTRMWVRVQLTELTTNSRSNSRSASAYSRVGDSNTWYRDGARVTESWLEGTTENQSFKPRKGRCTKVDVGKR